MSAVSYQTFFGLQRQPFVADLDREHILEAEDLLAVADRLQYAAGLGAIALVTREVGSGKSTALR